MALLNYKSMDCFHADEFCPYGKKNCLFRDPIQQEKLLA